MPDILRLVRSSIVLAATVGISTILALLALEIGVRLWDGVPLDLRENFVARELDAVHKMGAVAVYDAQLGWTPRPNSRWDAKGDPVQSGGYYTFGSYGVRMPSQEIVSLQQGAILVVGDSFAVGSEVPDEDSWPAQLERLTKTQVINAGSGGYGFDQIVLRAQDLLPRLKPRSLVVQTRLEFGISVSRMSIYGGAPKPFFAVQGGRLLLNNEPVPRTASSSRDLGWLRSVLGYSYLVQYAMTRLNQLQWWIAPRLATKFVISEDEAVNVTCFLMRRLSELRIQYNIPIALVLQYSALDGINLDLAWEKERDRATECAKHEHIEVIDSLDALRATYRNGGISTYQKLWVMHESDRVYGHMSAEGNQLIANLIYARLFDQKAFGSLNWAR